ncbi:SDR family oxidoreductase [Novosphingobium flavum]|uniref:SDR family oxidoreductase n=1 Tax=Novosphingobium flavum TaxID=1778672 RepID=A0A7X1FUI3_9SPHN|nr:SDR family oxidoreductase [Novosphingobium flavum]MBC2667220.1 SDR family oxidoreductase [Novosphingobium flavum]
MTQTILILGARSDIGLAVAHAFAAKGWAVQLAARDAVALSAEQADIAVRFNVPVTLHELDALDLAAHERFIAALPVLPDVAVTAIGLMGEQAENEADPAKAVTVLRSNFEGPANLFAILANCMIVRGSGTLVGISSVAGIRGRAANYVYGSAKAGFTAFLSGLRNRLAKGKTGVHVVTVLPGFVNTRMTAGMDLPRKLTAEPKELGQAVWSAVEKGRDVIYVRPIWRLVMLIIRHIPEAVFKKLSI